LNNGWGVCYGQWTVHKKNKKQTQTTEPPDNSGTRSEWERKKKTGLTPRVGEEKKLAKGEGNWNGLCINKKKNTLG